MENQRNLEVLGYDVSNIGEWPNSQAALALEKLFDVRTAVLDEEGVRYLLPFSLKCYEKGKKVQGDPRDYLYHFEFEHNSQGHTRVSGEAMENPSVFSGKTFAEFLASSKLNPGIQVLAVVLKLRVKGLSESILVRHLRYSGDEWEVFSNHQAVVAANLYEYEDRRVDLTHLG